MTRSAPIVSAFIALAAIAGLYAGTRSSITVLDGDTIVVGQTHFRLVGFDAPELYHPRCEFEFRLAQKARDRMVALTRGDLSLEPIACSCRPGAKTCNYGRSCAILRVGGRDVADIMIEEGLAVRYVYTWDHPPQRKQWCTP